MTRLNFLRPVLSRNCEMLYQTAEVSHSAAEQTSDGLTTQNEALAIAVDSDCEQQEQRKNFNEFSTHGSQHSKKYCLRGLILN